MNVSGLFKTVTAVCTTVTDIYRQFLIRSHVYGSLVIPNNDVLFEYHKDKSKGLL